MSERPDASRPLTHGDYTQLAAAYARHRAGYAPTMPAALFGLTRDALDATRPPVLVDVGAGTGIWTRSLAELGCRTIAIEPNDAMRALGEGHAANAAHEIEWRVGSAENTGLAQESAELVTMASAFHWTDVPRAIEEFARVLRPGGVFAALWNTRILEGQPLLEEIEAELRRLVPELEPRASGGSAFCAGLRERLLDHDVFDRVTYLESRHVERMTPERYLGLWHSVNDVRVQAGEERFARFLAFVERRLAGRASIDCPYRTRAWAARVPLEKP